MLCLGILILLGLILLLSGHERSLFVGLIPSSIRSGTLLHAGFMDSVGCGANRESKTDRRKCHGYLSNLFT